MQKSVQASCDSCSIAGFPDFPLRLITSTNSLDDACFLAKAMGACYSGIYLPWLAWAIGLDRKQEPDRQVGNLSNYIKERRTRAGIRAREIMKVHYADSSKWTFYSSSV